MDGHDPLDSGEVGIAIEVLSDHGVLGYHHIVRKSANHSPNGGIHLLRIVEHEVGRNGPGEELLQPPYRAPARWRGNQTEVVAVPAGGFNLVGRCSLRVERDHGYSMIACEVLDPVVDYDRAADYPAMRELFYHEEDVHECFLFFSDRNRADRGAWHMI